MSADSAKIREAAQHLKEFSRAARSTVESLLELVNAIHQLECENTEVFATLVEQDEFEDAIDRAAAELEMKC